MINELCLQIRDYINEPRSLGELIKNKILWNKLCASLDLLEDTKLALEYYKLQSFPDDMGAKYFHIYGILQTLFLQQDALQGISEVLHRYLNYKKDYPDLHKIRQIRNDIAGHPTNRGRQGTPQSFHKVIQHSIQRNKFSAMSEYFTLEGKQERRETNNYNLLNIVSIQERLTEQILKELVTFLKEENKAFMDNYGGVILRDKLEAHSSYHISKLSSLTSGAEDVNLDMVRTAHFQIIKDRICDFKEQVIVRYGSLDNVDAIKFKLEMIDYVINKIERYFDQQYDLVEARVIVYTLDNLYDDLLALAGEIDAEFNPDLIKKQETYNISPTAKINNLNELPVALKVKDVAELLGISIKSAYSLVKQRGFPAIKVGEKRIVIPKDKFIQWMDEQSDKSYNQK